MKQQSRPTHKRIDEDQGSTDSCKMAEDFRQLSIVDAQIRLLQKLTLAIAAELDSAESQAANISPTRM